MGATLWIFIFGFSVSLLRIRLTAADWLPRAGEKCRFARISHRGIRKIVITPVLLRCGVGSGSVTYATVCSFTTHLPRLVLQAFSRFLPRADEKCRLTAETGLYTEIKSGSIKTMKGGECPLLI